MVQYLFSWNPSLVICENPRWDMSVYVKIPKYYDYETFEFSIWENANKYCIGQAQVGGNAKLPFPRTGWGECSKSEYLCTYR